MSSPLPAHAQPAPSTEPGSPPDTRGTAGVVLVAAGSGQRLGQGIPKARVLCGGMTLLERALRGILASGVAAEVAVVIPEGDTALADAAAAVPSPVPVRIVPGGESRSASVAAGIAALSGGAPLILVHDAARALTPPEVFRRVAGRLIQGAPAVLPVLPVADTVKTVRGGQVAGTPDRAELRAVQTPQGFAADVLRAAHARPGAGDPLITDDSMLVEAQGTAVLVVDGDAAGFKITTPLDLLLAEALLAEPLAATPGQSTIQVPSDRP